MAISARSLASSASSSSSSTGLALSLFTVDCQLGSILERRKKKTLTIRSPGSW